MFATAQKLRRHEARKRPCEPVVAGGWGEPNCCEVCGRVYSRPDSLKRHRESCALVAGARLPAGAAVAALLQRQREHFEAELALRDAALAALAARLDALTGAAPAPAGAAPALSITALAVPR